MVPLSGHLLEKIQTLNLRKQPFEGALLSRCSSQASILFKLSPPGDNQ